MFSGVLHPSAVRYWFEAFVLRGLTLPMFCLSTIVLCAFIKALFHSIVARSSRATQGSFD